MASDLSEVTSAALRDRLERAREAHRLPSVVAGALVEGELAWAAGLGHVDGRGGPAPDVDTRYGIGSITKSLTAAVVMQLRDEGALALDDPVSAHLEVPAAIAQVGIGDLVGHASGVRAETSPPWWERSPGRSWEDLLDDLSDPAEARPATRGILHYSNVGYAILGRIVAACEGRSWFDAVSARLLVPAGMTRTGLAPDDDAALPLAVHPDRAALLVEPSHDYGAMAPAGQLWSSVGDLARWARAVSGRSPEVLAPSVAVEMGRPRLVATLDPPTAFGRGLQAFHHDGQALVGHGGSVPGFVANLVVRPTDGVGVVVVANSTAGMGTDLATDLLDLVASAVPAGRVGASTDPAVRDLVGTWWWGPRPVTVTVHASGTPLVDLGTTWRTCRLEAVAGDVWVGRDGYFDGERFEVVRDDDGAITHLELASFALTRGPYERPGSVSGGPGRGWQPNPAEPAADRGSGRA